MDWACGEIVNKFCSQAIVEDQIDNLIDNVCQLIYSKGYSQGTRISTTNVPREIIKKVFARKENDEMAPLLEFEFIKIEGVIYEEENIKEKLSKLTLFT